MAGSGSKVKIAIPIFLIFLSSILLFPFLTNSLTINEVIARTPAFHLINEIYVFLSGSYEPISNWLVFEPEALKVNKTILKIGEKVTIMGNGSESPGLNADKVDGLEAADLLAGGGVGGMPLQGVIVLKDSPSDMYGISSVPIALPKENCDVKITVCDYYSNPPTKLIIGADPVPRIEKSRNDIAPISSTIPPLFFYKWYWFPYKWNCTLKPENTVKATLGVQSSTVWGRAGCPTYPYYDVEYHYSGPIACPNGYTFYCHPIFQYDNATCYQCPSGYDNFDCEDKVCFKEPRCPSAGAGEVFIKEDDVDNVCVYCPSDHPIYDPTTKHCLKEASVNTTKVGNCATLTTTLKFAFTDVTFADEHSDPLSTADYVAIAYVCPE